MVVTDPINYDESFVPSINLVEMGIPQGDGVLAAFIPANGDMLSEALYTSGKREFTAFHLDNVVLDLFPLTDSNDVKWWMVKASARELSLDVIQPIWHGPAEEFKIESISRTSQRPGTVLAIRQWARGPWLTLEKRETENTEETETDGKEEI